LSASPLAAATYTVTNTADSGPGSLRQALLDANANHGLDSIVFSISGMAPFTITPGSALPSVDDPVVLDGTTQPGYAGTPLIEINGANLPSSTDGLVLNAGGSTIAGLAINRCPRDAIRIESLGTNNIQANFLGTDPSGTLARPNGEGGVFINGSPGNLVGGYAPSAANVISGGNQSGIFVMGASATGNIIAGNLIGTAVTGRSALGNVNNGVEITGAPGNLVGGTDPGAGNVISGNGLSGVYLLTPGATGNLVQGNIIGLNLDGTAAIGNVVDGVTIYGVSGNTVGGTTPEARNIVSGNGASGVDLFSPGASNNLVQGNYIGTDVSGLTAIGNLTNGVLVNGVPGNTIGGAVPGAGNTVSGNHENGILLAAGASGNQVQGNYVGVDATGLYRLANAQSGVDLDASAGNLVGGPGAGNVISGNGGSGIQLVDTGGGTNAVEGNLIGTDATGKKAVANGQAGIYVGVPGNTIGGTTAALRNVISGNSANGIFVIGIGASNNLIEGNYIGTDILGGSPLGNSYAGIAISNASATLVGGASAGAGNLISANGDSGISLNGVLTAATVIQGNYIGSDATGGVALGNSNGGIYSYGSGNNTIGGATAGAGNLISGNLQEGVSIGDPGANNNTIQGNFIGTKTDGLSPLGNQLHNIDFSDTAANNLVGGTTPGADNHIAFAQNSQYDGVRVRVGCLGNFVSRNSIFSNGLLGIVIGPIAGLNTTNLVTLAQAIGSGQSTLIQGSLSTYANGRFLIQFYENTAPNPSGYGEGMIYLGSTNLTTGANGVANFTLTLPAGVPVGKYIAATATDQANTTWEFGADAQVQAPPQMSISASGALASPSTISVSWPATPAGFVLQQSARLGSPAVWMAPTNPVTLRGINNYMTARTTDAAMYYRVSFDSQAAGTPILSILSSTPGNLPATVTLSWPAFPAGSALQQTLSLTTPVRWSAATDSVTLSGNTNFVTIPQTRTSTFYRLSVP
jgi:titin